MPPTRAATSYKKLDGSLTVSEDNKYLFWTPSAPPGSSPTVTIPVADVDNLQQSKADTPKVALRVVLKDGNYTFNFTSKDNARKEQQTITDTLRHALHNSTPAAIPLADAAPAPTSAGDGDGGAQSGSMTFAKAVSSKAAEDVWYDDSKLKNDFQLQRSLLESNKPLNDRFQQALRDKPESVSIPQFTAQFWSGRLHLLRAHAIEQQQQLGEYNVLPEIKYTTVHKDNGEPSSKMLNVTKEQIKLIFKQYPVVKHAYNAECPPMKPNEFWTRFFQSRLLKKLKGSRIGRDDPQDAMLDKYLDWRESAMIPATNEPSNPKRLPHFIDLSGNEQNHSQRKGNRPDFDMRESNFDQPILHVLNSLSEKMLQHIRPEDDRQAHAPIGMDEETFEQLQLRDLAMTDADNRVVLNVREQQRYVASQGEDDLSADARLYAAQDPAEVLSSLRLDLQPSKLGSDQHGRLRLDQAIAFHSDDDDDSESEDERQANGTTSTTKRRQQTRINSHPAIKSASTTILGAIKQRRTNASSDPHSLNGLSQTTFDTLAITQNTTIEFLHYFWTLFLSGDSTRTQELAQLVTTLERSLDRINAVGETAEKERRDKVDRLRKQVKEYYEKTGKKRKFDESGVGGGKAVVAAMVRPTVEALRRAGDEYQRVLEVQTREAQIGGGGGGG